MRKIHKPVELLLQESLYNVLQHAESQGADLHKEMPNILVSIARTMVGSLGNASMSIAYRVLACVGGPRNEAELAAMTSAALDRASEQDASALDSKPMGKAQPPATQAVKGDGQDDGGMA